MVEMWSYYKPCQRFGNIRRKLHENEPMAKHGCGHVATAGGEEGARTFGCCVLGRPVDHKRSCGEAVEVIARGGCHSYIDAGCKEGKHIIQDR